MVATICAVIAEGTSATDAAVFTSNVSAQKIKLAIDDDSIINSR
jgi:hypothetical protein